MYIEGSKMKVFCRGIFLINLKLFSLKRLKLSEID
jgi:hypothetical protein